MKKIIAPFSEEEVYLFNKMQTDEKFHGYTCDTDTVGGCGRRSEENNFGKLIATKDCLVCSCGKYKQKWFYAHF